MLAYFNLDKLYRVEYNSSNYVIVGAIEQLEENGLQYSITFYLLKINLAKCNYKIYDKELIAIIKAFEKQRLELISVLAYIFTNYRGLQYFIIKKALNYYQARQSKFLSTFNFKIKYQPSKNNTKANSLSRRIQNIGGEGK